MVGNIDKYNINIIKGDIDKDDMYQGNMDRSDIDEGK